MDRLIFTISIHLFFHKIYLPSKSLCNNIVSVFEAKYEFFFLYLRDDLNIFKKYFQLFGIEFLKNLIFIFTYLHGCSFVWLCPQHMRHFYHHQWRSHFFLQPLKRSMNWLKLKGKEESKLWLMRILSAIKWSKLVLICSKYCQIWLPNDLVQITLSSNLY